MGSVLKVFRRPGNPIIKLCHLIFNKKCHVYKCHCFIQLPIELPIELPIVLPIELPIELRPGPGPDRVLGRTGLV